MSEQTEKKKWAFEYSAEVPARYMQNIRAQLNSANNKLRKKGLPPFEMEVGKPQSRMIPVELQDKTINIQVNYYEVRVWGSPFDFGPYRARGWADLSVTPPQLHDVSGKVSPEELNRMSCAECDQCKTKRNRQKMFLVDNTETGDTLQVGGECAKDIFMGLSPERVASTLSVAAFAYELGEEMERCLDDYLMSTKDSMRMYEDTYGINVIDFVALTIEHLKTNDYVSKATASHRPDTLPTSGAVMLEYNELSKGRKAISDEQVDQAAKVLRTVESALAQKVDHSDFESNLAQLCRYKDEFVSPQFAGYLAFMPQMAEKLLSQDSAKDSVHLGKVGEKASMLLQYKGATPYDNMYGGGFRHSMADEEGNELVMFSTLSASRLGIRKGEWFKGDFTVKDHSSFRNIQQTQVKSLKVLASWDFKPDADTMARGVRTEELANTLSSFTQKAQKSFKKVAIEANENVGARERALYDLVNSGVNTNDLLAQLKRWSDAGIVLDDLTVSGDLYYCEAQMDADGKRQPVLLGTFIEAVFKHCPFLKDDYPDLYAQHVSEPDLNTADEPMAQDGGEQERTEEDEPSVMRMG